MYKYPSFPIPDLVFSSQSFTSLFPFQKQLLSFRFYRLCRRTTYLLLHIPIAKFEPLAIMQLTILAVLSLVAVGLAGPISLPQRLDGMFRSPFLVLFSTRYPPKIETRGDQGGSISLSHTL
jgi:hypothetical protein